VVIVWIIIIEYHLLSLIYPPTHHAHSTESNFASFTMKVSIVALAALVGFTSAQKAVVINSCTVPVYVQSFPYNGGAAGPLTTVQPGNAFSENFRPSGSVRDTPTSR
jgi:hypothetical protein